MDGKKTQDECVFETGPDEVDQGSIATVVKISVKADYVWFGHLVDLYCLEYSQSNR